MGKRGGAREPPQSSYAPPPPYHLSLLLSFLQLLLRDMNDWELVVQPRTTLLPQLHKTDRQTAPHDTYVYTFSAHTPHIIKCGVCSLTITQLGKLTSLSSLHSRHSTTVSPVWHLYSALQREHTACNTDTCTHIELGIHIHTRLHKKGRYEHVMSSTHNACIPTKGQKGYIRARTY